MNFRYSVLPPGWKLLPLFLAMSQGLFVGLAAAQDTPKSTAPAKSKPAKEKPQKGNESAKTSVPEDSAPNEVLVMPLKSAEAAEAARLLKILLGMKTPEGEDSGDAGAFVPIAVDQRTNSIIVNAPVDKVARIRSILTKLDVAPDPRKADPGMLSVVPLGSIQPDQSLEDALKLVFLGKLPNSNFTLDRQRKAVIIWADDNTKRAAMELLARLEQTGEVQKLSGASMDVRIRVIWLVNGLASQKEAPPLPEDLKEILPGLAKLGIDQPRLAAQTLVNVTPNRSFQTTGMAKLDYSCLYTVGGLFTGGTEPPKLEIEIRATRQKEKSTEEICSLRTTISAPLGHLVVLGITPTQETTSAFVVQVLGPEVHKSGERK